MILASGLFDPVWFDARNPGTPHEPLAAATHYLWRQPNERAVDPGPDFDAAWYVAENPDIGGANPLLHYLRIGRYRLRATSPSARAAAEQARRKALGLDLPRRNPRLAIGFAAGDDRASARAVRAASVAIAEAGVSDCLVLWSGAPEDAPAGTHALDLPERDRGGGAAHDRMLRYAAEGGATLYVAADAHGFFAPDALSALLRMSAAAGDLALVGATEFPAEHPRCFDPVSFETDWTGGGCLLLPVRPVLDLGGFETALDAIGLVDLCWRARQAGLRVLTCPNALYVTAGIGPGAGEVVEPEHLLEAYRLARLWGGARAAAAFGDEIRHLGATPPEPGPDRFARAPRIADWSHGFAFAPARW